MARSLELDAAADDVARATAKASGSRSFHTGHRGAGEPVRSRIALTARRAASLAPSIVARSVCVRT